MTQVLALAERMRANLRAQTEKPVPAGLIANERALAGLTIAVQELTAAHLYAESNLEMNQLVLCESLPVAFESVDAATDPVIDVILGAEPVLEFRVFADHSGSFCGPILCKSLV